MDDGATLANELEQCIRSTAARIAATASRWEDRCISPAQKVGFQAKQLELTLTPVFRARGLSVALWCAFYAAHMPLGWPYETISPGMFGFEQLLCPEVGGGRRCEDSDDGAGVEALGSAIHEARGKHNKGAAARPYRVRMYAMSCALCRRMRERLGPPPFIAPRGASSVDADAPRYARMRANWTAQWDMHAFGEWLAATSWPSPALEAPTKVLGPLASLRVTNGEALHGFLWRSLDAIGRHGGGRGRTRRAEGLLAPPQPQLQSQSAQPPRPPPQPQQLDQQQHAGPEPLWWVRLTCAPSFSLDVLRVAGQSVFECAHGAGHGLFQFHRARASQALEAPPPSLPRQPSLNKNATAVVRSSVGATADHADASVTDALPAMRAVASCNHEWLADAWREAARQGGRTVSPDDLADWRRVCRDGVWHAALNSLGAQELRALAKRGARSGADVLRHVCGAALGGGGSAGVANAAAAAADDAGAEAVGDPCPREASGEEEAGDRLRFVVEGMCGKS